MPKQREEDNLVKFRCLSKKQDYYIKNPPQVTLSNGRKMYMVERADGMKCAKTGQQVALKGSKGNDLGPLYSSVPKSKL